MDTPTKKYNLRSNSKSKSSNKEDEEKYNLKQNGSDDDNSYYSDEDSDYEYGENDDMDLDIQEYRKFLSTIYPSNHLSKKIESGEMLKQHLIESQKVVSDNDSDYKDEDENHVSNNISNSDTDQTNSDTDNDGEDEDDDENDNEKEFFNIVFTIGAPKEDDSMSYDDSDSDNDTQSETSDDNDNDNISKNNTSNESEQEDEDIQKIFKKNTIQKKSTKKQVKTLRKNTQSKTNKDKDKGSDNNNKKENKKNKESNDTPIIDDTSSKAMREMITLFKKRKGKASDTVFKKMEKYLEEEELKMNKKREKEEKKIKLSNTKKLRKLLKGKDVMNDYKFFKTLSIDEQKNILKKVKELETYNGVDKPYRLKLIESPIPAKYKASAMRKINTLNHMDPGSGEYYKIKQWVDIFMSIPFGVYRNLPIHFTDGVDKCNEFMSKSIETLDNAVYGLNDAKMQIMQMMGQWISNPDAVGTAIAIKGPMGTGKTTLVKEGISKILNRPFAFIALGGATDSSFMEGHSYTYEGSTWGKIVDIIIQSKCMNPVIYFDELDKVSDTPKGEEIIGILTHLTDTTQNSQFHDKYFSNIDFDLSKVLFIFSYNDEHKVNPILKDRMYRIETKGYDSKEKITIARKYLIPSIERNINFQKDEIQISDDALKYIIQEYTQKEKGVRNFKRCLEILYTKLNLFRLMKPNTKLFEGVETFDVTLPFTITHAVVDKLIHKINDDTWQHSMYT